MFELLHTVNYVRAEEESSRHGAFRAEQVLLRTAVSRCTHGWVGHGGVRKSGYKDSLRPPGCGRWHVKKTGGDGSYVVGEGHPCKIIL